MDYEIILSPTALASLKEATANLANEDPFMAEKIGNKLLDRVDMLRKFPKAGSVYGPNKKWRKLVSRPYVIIYRINARIHAIEVLAFRHSARMSYLG